MGNRHHPGSAYVVPLKDIVPYVTGSKSVLEDIIQNDEWSELEEFLNENLPEEFPPIAAVYCPSIEDEWDENMEDGVMYVLFDEDDLYEKTPKKGLEFMRNLNINPQFCNYAPYG
jgi:hypothetical protein